MLVPVRMAVPVATLLSLSIAACAADDEPGGMSGGTAPPITLELQHEIGSFDDPEQSLTRLRTGLLLPSGELLIPQPEDAEIRRYDAGGALVAKIGRRGEGPGEFGGIGSIGRLGDTIWVHDSGNTLIHRFDLEGTLLSSTSWTPVSERVGEGLVVWGYALTLRPDGRALEAPSVSFRAGAQIDLDGYPVGVVEPNGEPPRDTVVFVSPAPFTSPAPEGSRALIQTGALMAPFRDGEGAYVIERYQPERPASPSFRVFAVSVAGDTLFDRAFSYTPVDTDEDALRADFMAGIDEQFRDRFRDTEFWAPETLPPVTAAISTSEGLLWLEREDTTDPRVWWALDQTTGERVATIELPAGEKIIDHLGDDLVTVYEDDLDVPYVRRYRVVR